MLTIHLDKLKFHSFHGIYDEEKIIGNPFEVSAIVELDVQEKITRLHQTVDYVVIYDIIKTRMLKSTALLETVAQELTELVHDTDKRIKSVSITIKKLSPPVENFQGTVGVSYKKEFAG